MSHIRKGDTVAVLLGREIGKRGRVLRILKDDAGRPSRVVVEKLNLVKRHTKPGQGNRTGGIVEKEAPISISNVMLIDPKLDRPTRVRTKVVDGKKVRVSVKSGEVIG